MSLLCTYCSALFLSPDLTPPLDVISHHQTVGELSQSAAHCALCKTIYAFLLLEGFRRCHPDLNGQAFDALMITLVWRAIEKSETAGVLWYSIEGHVDSEHHDTSYFSKFTITTPVKDGSASQSPLWKGRSSSFEQKCAVIKSWLEECTSNHPDCSPPAGGFYPSRLIYVGMENENPRLVESKSEALRGKLEYAALSHCWGDLRSTTLSKKSLTEWQTGIPLNILPRIFLEAIQIMRQVGIPYLWIDSLCIIQDDLDDWTREAAGMMHVYSGSSIVLSAEDSWNCAQGCFVDIQQDSFNDQSLLLIQTLTVQPRRLDQTLDLRVYNYPIEYSNRGNILRSRGWTMQEELLAHREVICTRPELRWRCQYLKRSEVGHESAVHNSLYREPPAGISHQERLWCDWMHDYSSRSFTFPMDRLSGVMGLVHYYRQSTGYEHVLACWRETMIDDLLWFRSTKQSTREKLLGVPSWSWLSQTTTVHFALWNHLFGWNHGRECVTPYSDIEDNTEVIQATVDWAGEPLLSGLLDSSLVLEGPLQEMKIRLDTRRPRSAPSYLRVGDEEAENEMNEKDDDPIPRESMGQFDASITSENDRYMCLLIKTVPIEGYPKRFVMTETFLMLVREPSKDGHEIFRRAGLAMTRGDVTMFSMAQRTRIRLI